MGLERYDTAVRAMNYQPDLFSGEGRSRPEPTTRAQNLSQARAEMMDTNSSTLFDVARPETWIDQLGTLHTISGRSGFYMKAPCGKVGLHARLTVRSTCQACQS